MVRWSDQAKADLRAIHNFIARDSSHYATKVTQDIVEKSETLSELPRIGRVVPEMGDDSVREIPAYSYRVLYEVTRGDIVILAVIHKRRDLNSGDIGA